MLASKIGVSGSIWFYSAWSILGTFFCYFFIRESRGLTDNEKKNLYTPSDLIEEEKPERKGAAIQITDRALTMAMTEEYTMVAKET